MNTLRNSVRLVGNLGGDPEVKTFDSNKQLAKFSLATSETYKNDKGERVTETQWHNLVAWGSQAKFIGDYLKKGDEVVSAPFAIISKTLTDKMEVEKVDKSKLFSGETK